MDINHILLLLASLNLLGDLYNILRFSKQLPGWILIGNLIAIAGCALAWLLAPADAGLIAIGILAVYFIVIKSYANKRAPMRRLPCPATKLLILANVAVFLYQLWNGATNDPVRFVALGALYTPLLEQGEWWRLLSAQFMHWGVLHLFCNMLGLWFLGPLTESILGPLRYIMAYLLCGAGGMLVAFGASLVATTPHSIVLLGASASVLGLVGIQAAFSLKAFRRSGSMVAKAQLASMLQIVVLQGIFDLMVPEVSSTAHIGGAAVGFVLGTFIFMRR